jgi:hypothetical protein
MLSKDKAPSQASQPQAKEGIVTLINLARRSIGTTTALDGRLDDPWLWREKCTIHTARAAQGRYCFVADFQHALPQAVNPQSPHSKSLRVSALECPGSVDTAQHLEACPQAVHPSALRKESQLQVPPRVVSLPASNIELQLRVCPAVVMVSLLVEYMDCTLMLPHPNQQKQLIYLQLHFQQHCRLVGQCPHALRWTKFDLVVDNQLCLTMRCSCQIQHVFLNDASESDHSILGFHSCRAAVIGH